jgi:hypothetical protein
MYIVSEQINRTLTLSNKVIISSAVVKSLQIRFKVTQKSLKQEQPSNENILLLITGFHVLVNPRRSPPYYHQV